jgi:hypothetical protein
MDNPSADAAGADSGRDADDKRDRLQKEILREQVAYLIEAMGGPDYAAVVWTEDGWLDYLYRPGYVLARDEHWREVAELLGADRVQDDRSQNLRGLTVLRVSTEADTTDQLSRVDRELGIGKATPDHILFVSPGGGGTLCPATEPEEPGGSPAPYPPITSDAGAGAGVFVSVVDTGWWPAAATDPATPWLAGVTGDLETIDLDNIHP